MALFTHKYSYNNICVLILANPIKYILCTPLLLLLLLLSVGSAESRLMHCSLPRLIVLNPLVWFPSSSPEERGNYGLEMAGQI
jgi:hypothetical protein